MIKKLSGLSAILYILPLSVLAQAIPPAQTTNQLPTSNINSLQQLGGLLCQVAVWMFNILIFVAIIFAIYAAFLYLTAGGDAEKIKKANHTLIYIAVAIAVALLARSVPFLVGSFMGGTAIGASC